MNETSTKLKICGITSLADARYCAGAGVDYLGFIQYESSPRYIEPSQAKEIIGWLYGPEPVGVFVNESATSINHAVAEVGFTHAQIHGDYEPEFFNDIKAKTIKAVSIHPHTTPEDLQVHFSRYADSVDYFLLDTAKAGLWGGTGTAFNWEIAKEIVQHYPTFIAGGIDASNILQVIEALHPYAVDLASGVEESPGVKDFDKLADLFDAFQSLNT
ncbi:MAG: phosphoribosylanthranilate isomerase [Rhodothermaceae bacterium]|nr:phosphoribosylanthranilate isomerase [Rhodothermaceae bacterium]